LVALLTALGAVGAHEARADVAYVSERLVLPLDGRPLDVAPFARPFDGRIRIVIDGAVFSSVDGNAYDAFTRRVGDRVLQEDGPFVLLPPGARVLESDPIAHRYTVELPARATAPLAFATSKLVSRYFLPRSEVAHRLDGKITVEVLAPTASPAASTAPPSFEASLAQPTPPEDGGDPLGFWVALFSMPLPLLWLLRRSPEEQRQLRRIERAMRAIDAEAHRLGPAFLPVISAARRVSDAADGIGRDAKRARAAYRRTAWVESSAAGLRRQEVQEREGELVHRLSKLAEQLEVLATELTAVDLDGASTRRLSTRLRDLMQELEEAVAARNEAETAAEEGS
jgi:hypothetical protein